jgi:hypothetical protein
VIGYITYILTYICMSVMWAVIEKDTELNDQSRDNIKIKYVWKLSVIHSISDIVLYY